MPEPMRYRARRKRLYFSSFEREALSRARAIHVTSEVEEEAVQLLTSGRTVVVPPGIDPPPETGVRREPGRVVFLGRLHPIKGFDLLFPAMETVARRVANAELVVAGLGSSTRRRQLQSLARASCPSARVRFVGGGTVSRSGSYSSRRESSFCHPTVRALARSCSRRWRAGRRRSLPPGLPGSSWRRAAQAGKSRTRLSLLLTQFMRCWLKTNAGQLVVRRPGVSP